MRHSGSFCTAPRRGATGRRLSAVLLAFLFLSCLVVSFRPSTARAELPGAGHRLVFSTFPSGGMRELFEHILTEAYARLGYEIELRSYPAERALLLANEGLSDGEAGRVSVVENDYPNLIRVPTPLYFNRVVVLTRDPAADPAADLDIDPAGGWAQFARYRTCIRNGYKFLESKLAGENCHQVSSYEKMLELLRNGRVDAGLALLFDILPTLDKTGMEGLRMLDRPMASNPMYHYLNRRHADLVPLIDAELRRMAAEGRLREIEQHLLREHYARLADVLPAFDLRP